MAMIVGRGEKPAAYSCLVPGPLLLHPRGRTGGGGSRRRRRYRRRRRRRRKKRERFGGRGGEGGLGVVVSTGGTSLLSLSLAAEAEAASARQWEARGDRESLH